MKRFAALAGVLAVASTSIALAQGPVAANYESTPFFTETFASGTPTGEWEADPGMTVPMVAATYVTATPGTINAAFVTANPLATATGGGAMMMGNLSSTAGTDFGLNYMRVVNTLANGTGEDLTALTEYRMVASLWLPSEAQVGGSAGSVRYQVGPYGYGGSLFRPGVWYNTGTTGLGPGFGQRGDQDGNSVLVSGALAAGRWTKMEVMFMEDGTDTDLVHMSVGVDTNGDNNIDENDANEFFSTGLNFLKSVRGVVAAPAVSPDNVPAPGIFTVGVISSDIFPLFVDSVELYKKATVSSTTGWELYN